MMSILGVVLLHADFSFGMHATANCYSMLSNIHTCMYPALGFHGDAPLIVNQPVGFVSSHLLKETAYLLCVNMVSPTFYN